ncbi:MAG: gluconolaconase [Flavobacterium sp.]|uniref:gluconolaconase n=1 Tax=Flavobacterium sp. TaxID=239 RepID=UPI001205ED15|nr:gluconolaconase [Flavobacterium sp.]RZJ66308.1 MAG: gluconolaconase [Flavobacterium sp.]
MKNLIIATLAVFSMTIPPQQKIEFEAPEAYPEGVAFNPANRKFYVSSARLGTIGEVSEDGKYKAIYTSPDLKSSYGIKVHADQKRVFVCLADANYSKFKSPETDKKMARLIAIDIKSGKKVLDVDLSKLVPGNHFSNDLTFDKTGNAYVTDSFANVVYKVTPDGKASVFAKSDLFKTQGVGLNGIAWHAKNFLLVANSGKGSVFKIDVANPAMVTKVELPQFLMNADGLLLLDANTLILVQNGGSNRIHKLQSSDDWKSARIVASTQYEDRFAYPSTATAKENDVWVMNAKFNELNDSTAVFSKKFSMQKAEFVTMK